MAPIRIVWLSIMASSFFFFYLAACYIREELLRYSIELKLVAKQFTAPMDISFSFDTIVNSVHSSAL